MGNQVEARKSRFRSIQYENTSALMRKSYRRQEPMRNNLSDQYVSLDAGYKKSKIEQGVSNIKRNRIYSNANSSAQNSLNEPQPREHDIFQSSVKRPFSRSFAQRATPRNDNDRILKNLSQKNQQLRRELKRISEQLSQKLKKKKFVPKKVKEQNEQQSVEKDKNFRALKREMQNAYRQIDMYKKNLENLKGKNTNEQAILFKIQRLQNDIADMDTKINSHIKKIQGLKKIKGGQDKAIDKQMNQQLHEEVSTYKYELQETKKKIKEIQKRQQQREGNYKKQQAYLCQVEKKLRVINDQYFTLKKEEPKLLHKKLHSKRTDSSDKTTLNGDPTRQDFQVLIQELESLRVKHEQYHKKIDDALQKKNKTRQENRSTIKAIGESQVTIKGLLQKLENLKHLSQPPKKNLFGSESFADEDIFFDEQPVVIQQKQPDQFDIGHLLANIPKPVRQKPIANIQVNNKIANKKSSKKPQQIIKKNLQVTLQKSQPKKWDSILSRNEECGKYFKGELLFDDADHFDGHAQPLIVGVNVWVNQNNSILGIQAIYLNKEDIRYGYKSSSIMEGNIQHYDLNRPDYLKNVTGSMNPDGYIQYLVLSSKNGKISRFGYQREGHQSFNFGLSSTQRPFLLFGASTLFQNVPKLNRLGLQICAEQ